MNDPFLRVYEFEKRYGLDRLKITLQKAEKAYKTHEPETVDFCKSALECVCKSILTEKGDTAHTGTQDVPKLIKATLRVLGHPNEQISGGITSLAQGIAQVRNSHTLAGHGMDEATPTLTKIEIEIFVKTFSHTVDVILTLLDGQEIDISTTRMTFDAVEAALNLAAVNEEIDTSVSVEYFADEGTLFLEGKELRPSEILFHFDRITYNQRVENAKESRFERLSEVLEALTHDYIRERLANFPTKNYGIKELEIAFDEIKVINASPILTGSVSAQVRLGSSNIDDSRDISYFSDFKAEFQCHVDDPNAFQLERLELEVVDWIRPKRVECYGS